MSTTLVYNCLFILLKIFINNFNLILPPKLNSSSTTGIYLLERIIRYIPSSVKKNIKKKFVFWKFNAI